MEAQAVGIAGHFLHTLLTTDVDGLIDEITRWQKQLTELYALVGARKASDLVNVPYILSPELKNYNDQRQKS